MLWTKQVDNIANREKYKLFYDLWDVLYPCNVFSTWIKLFITWYIHVCVLHSPLSMLLDFSDDVCITQSVSPCGLRIATLSEKRVVWFLSVYLVDTGFCRKMTVVLCMHFFKILSGHPANGVWFPKLPPQSYKWPVWVPCFRIGQLLSPVN